MKVYLDNAATTQMSERAFEAMSVCLRTSFGNASSAHLPGQEARTAMENARKEIALQLNAQPQEIYFTSGGTEADCWAIHAFARLGERRKKRHIISSAFEHHAVLRALEDLQMENFEITLLPVHQNGLVCPDELREKLREDTALVTIMFANNEIGTVQPIQSLGAICKEAQVPFHTDAVQAVGHIPINVVEQNISALSLSAHKFHGPKGIGVLYCKASLPLLPFIPGGMQERGKRGGTENIPAIIGMSTALQEMCDHMDTRNLHVATMRDKLMETLSAIPHSYHNGNAESRLPGIVNFSFEGINGDTLIQFLNEEGIYASSGSACTAASSDPSHVLMALGCSRDMANSSLRLSLSEKNTMEEIQYIQERIPAVIQRLRNLSPAWSRIQK